MNLSENFKHNLHKYYLKKLFSYIIYYFLKYFYNLLKNTF